MVTVLYKSVELGFLRNILNTKNIHQKQGLPLNRQKKIKPKNFGIDHCIFASDFLFFLIRTYILDIFDA